MYELLVYIATCCNAHHLELDRIASGSMGAAAHLLFVDAVLLVSYILGYHEAYH